MQNEILSLVKIQRASHDMPDAADKLVHLFDVFEDSKYVHLVLENSRGISLKESIMTLQAHAALNHEF